MLELGVLLLFLNGMMGNKVNIIIIKFGKLCNTVDKIIFLFCLCDAYI